MLQIMVLSLIPKQQDIYNSLFTELTEAVAQFDDGAAMKGDILSMVI